MSADLPAVGIRLLDDRLTGWGFPRWGSSAAAGLDLHACLDAALDLAPDAPAALIPAGFCVLIRDPACAVSSSPARGGGIGTGWCSATAPG